MGSPVEPTRGSAPSRVLQGGVATASTLLLLLTLVLLPLTAAADSAERPNIILLLADDLGYGDIGCYGAPDVRTPNLDRLSRQGVRFTQHYSNGPECSPTRAALLSGRYQQRVGGLECAIGTGNVGRYDDAIRLANRHNLGLPVEDATLPQTLQAAGYALGIFGKWHLGYESKFNPLNYGFEQFFGCLGGNVDYFTHAELSPLLVTYRDRKPTERPGYMTHLIADDAIQFIRQNHQRPFLLYVPFTSPHFPFQGPADEGLPFNESNWMSGTRDKYVELINDLDGQCGRILSTLDELGLQDKSIVVFASDNGAMHPGRNLPMRDYKSRLFEGGIRVPLIIRWPGQIQPDWVSHQVSITMDLTRSFVRIAGGQLPPDRTLDGFDIVAHAQRRNLDVPRTLFWRARRGERTERAVRAGDLKYLHRRLDDGTVQQYLFDLYRDPRETTNLVSARVADVQRLKTLLEDWQHDVQPLR